MAGRTFPGCRSGAYRRIEANSGEEIHGTNQADVIYALNGDDRIWGYDQLDVISGGDQADKIYGGNEPDVLYGQEGNDDTNYSCCGGGVYGNSGDDEVYGNVGIDWLEGNAGNDDLYGGDQWDDLTTEGDGQADFARGGDPGSGATHVDECHVDALDSWQGCEYVD
ncbi:MAG: hypothetical protein U0R52_00870 [Solirubrobacterales bacterium]